MRVLIVSWYFPPANTIAAVRMQGMAAYLRRQGAEVRVLTAAGIPWPQTLETDVPETVVTATPWADVPTDRKSTRLNSSHYRTSRMPSSA